MTTYTLRIDIMQIIISLPVYYIFFMLLKVKSQNRIIKAVKIFVSIIALVRITEISLYLVLNALMNLKNSSGEILSKIWSAFGVIGNVAILFSLGLLIYGIWLNSKEGVKQYD